MPANRSVNVGDIDDKARVWIDWVAKLNTELKKQGQPKACRAGCKAVVALGLIREEWVDTETDAA